MRPHQLVVLGASGFTGQRVLENLVRFLKTSGTSLRWAVSGRNERKLKQTLQQVSRVTDVDVTGTEILTASLQDHGSLARMACAADVVMNCTGPFRETGAAVVAACVDAATDYLDIAGEPQFMEQTQLTWHRKAQDKSIYVIPGSGTDCIPSDCGVNYLRDHFDGHGIGYVFPLLAPKVLCATFLARVSPASLLDVCA